MEKLVVPLVTPDATALQNADEGSLIRRAQKGDRTAFSQLIELYYERLHRWLYHLTHDPHLAEDLVQETLLRAFANVERFRPGSNFRAWLFRIAHNNWINHYRANKRCRDALPNEVPQKTTEEPVDQLVREEEHARLAEAVEQLPDEIRATLLLRIDEELSFRQIAGIMDLTEETARWRVFKARKQLMQLLDSAGKRDPS